MLKRTLAGLAFVLAVSAVGSSPASAFGWCGFGFRAYSAPTAYYAPRARYYYRPSARLYRPAFGVYRRAYYRPFVGRALYRPGFRAGIRRSYYRPYRPAVVARAAFRPGIRSYGPRARAFRPGVRASFSPRGRAFYRGRLP
jgi:hypothetical protein